MVDRRERIPASEVKDSKRWNLPFWTDPNRVVHSEEPEEDVLVEDEELEVEPLTAEQLETIRQEAFNEGLEQGIVEGRQKGEKLGYDDGHAEGKSLGENEGRKLGFDAGFEQGEKQAFENGTLEHEKISKQLQSLLNNIKQQMTEQKQELALNIPDIVLSIAKAVVTEELSQGSEHIVGLVQQALNALPLESGEIKIEVNPQDLPYIEAAIEQGEFEGVAHGKDSIDAGGCRIHTRYSSVDFTLSERWQAIEKQYRHQLQLALNQSDDEGYDFENDVSDSEKKILESKQPEKSIDDHDSDDSDAEAIDSGTENSQNMDPDVNAQVAPVDAPSEHDNQIPNGESEDLGHEQSELNHLDSDSNNTDDPHEP